MNVRNLVLAVGLVASAAGLDACVRTTTQHATATTAQSAPISAHVLAIAHRNAVAMAAQARKADARLRAKMAKLVRVRVLSSRDLGQGIALVFEITNRSAKPLTQIGGAMEVRRVGHSARIGLIELHLKITVTPHARVRIERDMWYLRFGEDAETMRAAARAPKRFTITIRQLVYADGTKVGRVL